MEESFWIDRPVLVTGASGLLGSWLVEKLVDMAADVTCLIRDWVPKSELVRDKLLQEVKVVRGDVRDQVLLERCLAEYEVDTVFHLAAQTIVPIANRNLISTLETNIGGTWSLLEACRRSPTVRQIVAASSDKAYGDQPNLPYTEDTPLAPRNPYDVSKACADLIASSYGTHLGVPVAITRCGNFFGGGDLNWSRIVPGTIRDIMRGRQPVVRSDGQYIRDYFYVEDAVAANILLAEHLAANRQLISEAFNFSYEKPMTVLQMVNSILGMMHSDLRPDVRNEATGEIQSQYLDAAKAHKVLGWKPLFTLDGGLKNTIKWYGEMLDRDHTQ